MNKKQFAVLIVVTFIGGIIGGFLFNQVGFIGQAHAKDKKIIEANEFRVVNSKGNITATLGPASGKNEDFAALQFSRSDGINTKFDFLGFAINGDKRNIMVNPHGIHFSTKKDGGGELPQIVISVDRNGKSFSNSIKLYDQNYNVRWSTP